MEQHDIDQAMDKYKGLKEDGYSSLEDKIHQENKRRAFMEYDRYLSNGGY